MTTILAHSNEIADESISMDKDPSMPLRAIKTMLVVEDNPLVRELEVVVLKESGYTVFEAVNGLEALRLAQGQRGLQIQLLLTDVGMPIISGQDLVSRLTEYFPDLKVLYVTGYSLETLLENGTLSEPVNHIQKPFTLDELRNKVRSLMDET